MSEAKKKQETKHLEELPMSHKIAVVIFKKAVRGNKDNTDHRVYLFIDWECMSDFFAM